MASLLTRQHDSTLKTEAMKARFQILGIALLMSASLVSQNLKVDCVVKTIHEEAEGILLTLEELDGEFKKTYEDVHAHRLVLEENKKYLLSFELEGYVTKAILIDTPKRLFRNKKISFDVILEPQPSEDILTYYAGPVGYIHFDGSTNMSYEKDYSQFNEAEFIALQERLTSK